MSTAVPSPSFTARGFTAPAETAILAGRQTDINTAFGGNVNPALETPQGQLASTDSAIIGDCYDQFLALANGVDPAYAAGRMQDAIGRIYFIERNPAQSTVVTATCVGLAGVIIPIGARAQAADGNIYLCTQAGTIPVGGSIDLTFACAITGPVACPPATLTTIYQAIPGWDSITNAAPGVEGNNVETRADFEFRRAASVALNAQGSLPAVLAGVFNVTGVLDAYAIENVLDVTSGAVCVASIATTTLAVSTLTSGTVQSGQTVTGSGVIAGTVITGQLTGTIGGVGTYSVSISQSVGSEAMVCAIGGVPLAPHSLYVAAYGGTAQDVGQAIWSNKSPGCNYNGNTTVTVVDSASGYHSPYPSYQVTFENPTPTPVLFAVKIANSPAVPSNAALLVQNAIIAAFVGSDGGARARIGSTIFASRYYAGVSALGVWASVVSIQIGIASADLNSLLMQIDQVPTITASDISVAFV